MAGGMIFLAGNVRIRMGKGHQINRLFQNFSVGFVSEPELVEAGFVVVLELLQNPYTQARLEKYRPCTIFNLLGPIFYEGKILLGALGPTREEPIQTGRIAALLLLYR